jgi:hypothetical protein
MRKGTRVALLLLALSAAAAVAALLLKPPSPSSRINPDAYARLKEGTTRAEVIAAIGLEPGDYRARLSSAYEYSEQDSWGHEVWLPSITAMSGEIPATRVDRWFGDDYAIQAMFDAQGGASYGVLLRSVRHSGWSWFDRLKALVGW